MKVLIAVEDLSYIITTLAALSHREVEPNSFYKLLNIFEQRISTFQFKHIQLDVIFIGKTSFEAAFHIGKVLNHQKYHLVLGLGLAGSLYDKIPLGKIVNVINDKPFGLGTAENQDLYQLDWLQKTAFPHQRGGFINLTNAYFNVFLPFYKVPAITVPVLKADATLKIENYPKDIETSNGLGFQYACLYEKANFYQLRAVAYNLATQETNEELAIQNLDTTLLQILNLL